MDRDIKLSIIVLTHNNYLLKNGCVETVLLSIVNQVNVMFEIIIVDNNSNNDNRVLLKQFVDDLTGKVNGNIEIKYIFNDNSHITIIIHKKLINILFKLTFLNNIIIKL